MRRTIPVLLALLTAAIGGRSAAAWSPNPRNPPFFFDLPSKEGQVQPAIAARWAVNAPLAMIDQYIPNLKDGDSTSNLMIAEVRDL
jgi:hypothetical protein